VEARLPLLVVILGDSGPGRLFGAAWYVISVQLTPI